MLDHARPQPVLAGPEVDDVWALLRALPPMKAAAIVCGEGWTCDLRSYSYATDASVQPPMFDAAPLVIEFVKR
jgi:hypothetical protein